jgi:hypothetical protein
MTLCLRGCYIHFLAAQSRDFVTQIGAMASVNRGTMT